MVEQTLSIIKPDATKRNLCGKIINHFTDRGFRIAAMKMTHLSRQQAEGFYIEHKDRPFFAELVEFMCSEPVVLMVLEAENAISLNRQVMGATNPSEADEGTIRKLYAKNIGENSVHGSDSKDSASREIAYFFSSCEIH